MPLAPSPLHPVGVAWRTEGRGHPEGRGPSGAWLSGAWSPRGVASRGVSGRTCVGGAWRGGAGHLRRGGGRSMGRLLRALRGSQPVARFQRCCGLFPAGDAGAGGGGGGGGGDPAGESPLLAACNGAAAGPPRRRGGSAGCRPHNGVRGARVSAGKREGEGERERGRGGRDSAGPGPGAGGARPGVRGAAVPARCPPVAAGSAPAVGSPRPALPGACSARLMERGGHRSPPRGNAPPGMGPGSPSRGFGISVLVQKAKLSGAFPYAKQTSSIPCC